MNCALCDAQIGSWTAPNGKGELQGWMRNFIVDGRGRMRCADRGACKARVEFNEEQNDAQ